MWHRVDDFFTHVCDDIRCKHQTDTACTWLMRHRRGGLCKLYSSILLLRRPHPYLGGSQPCIPASWLAERLLLAGDFQSRTKTKTKNPFTHTHSTPTLTKYTNLSVQPLNPSHPHSTKLTRLLNHPHLFNPLTLSTSPHTHSLHS